MDPTGRHAPAPAAQLLLLPIVLLALAVYALSPSFTGELNHYAREYLSFACRLIFPCMVVLCAAALLPARARTVQLFLITAIYSALLTASAGIRPSSLLNPSICVISAAAAIMVLRPQMDFTALEHLETPAPLNRLGRLLFAVLLPAALFAGLITIIRQIEFFVYFTVSESFGRTLLAMIFCPIYLFLETMGFQNAVTNAALMSYQADMASSFINAVFAANFIALPAMLFTRSLFAKEQMRLFLTLLGLTAILTMSVGPCASLILLIVLVLLPGSFVLLCTCSLCLFLCSYLLNLPPVTNINNLYHPDIDLTAVRSFSRSQALQFFCALGVLFPCALTALFAWIKKERLTVLRQRRSINQSGVNLQDQLTPDLAVIALLRAVGGLSNLIDVSLTPLEGLLRLELNDPQRCRQSMLLSLSLKKPHYSREHHACVIDLGELTYPVQAKLKLLTAENPARPATLISTRGFKITPLPHLRAPGRSRQTAAPN